MIDNRVTGLILKAYYNVYNALGYGFLEKVNENALLIELRSLGLEAVKQVPIDVYFKEDKVGLYYADIIVNSLIIIEVKATEGIREKHEFQLINYLKATDIEIGFVLNFGKSPEFKRKIFSNDQR